MTAYVNDTTAMPAVFARYENLPDPIQKALRELEDFIGELDGKTIAIPTTDNTFIDDGTVDADDAVRAFNLIVAALADRAGTMPSEEEIARAICIGGSTRCPLHITADGGSFCMFDCNAGNREGLLASARRVLAILGMDQPTLTTALHNGDGRWTVGELALAYQDYTGCTPSESARIAQHISNILPSKVGPAVTSGIPRGEKDT